MTTQPTLEEVCEKYWPEGCDYFGGNDVEGPRYFSGPIQASDLVVFLFPRNADDEVLLDNWLPIIAATAWAWWVGQSMSFLSDGKTEDWHFSTDAQRAWASLIRWEAA